jgi:diguanylate cyclase (GGDEF)-like protein
VTVLHAGDQPWTSVVMRALDASILQLLIAGDWTLSSGALGEWAYRVGRAFERVAGTAPSKVERGLLAAYTLPRRLAGAGSLAEVYQLFVDACARATGAEKASIAVYRREQQSLAIGATFGYPAVLVSRLRFRPGIGIIGTVFSSGRALRVNDVRGLPGVSRPRLRYRTSSFMSVPLRGSSGVVGVSSVSDPRGGGTFGRTDLRTLRALAWIGGLALDRAKALEEAAASAHAAAVDPLTGLFNRRHFHLRLDEEVERARRQASPLALLLIDVDHFKPLNDRLGHLIGDAVLRVVGDVLRRSIRLFDVCARYGGDEFAILMPGGGTENARQIAERIREGVEDSRPSVGPWVHDLRVTASIGMATFAGEAGEELIERADRALYEAKRLGRNRVHVSEAAEPPG